MFPASPPLANLAPWPIGTDGFLARSKLEPGTAVADRVERRLEAEGIEALRAVRLTLVHAPAGYGKTTTLGQWFRRLRGAGSRVAWLSLDEFDATVDQFAGNLLEACAEAGSSGADSGSRRRTRTRRAACSSPRCPPARASMS